MCLQLSIVYCCSPAQRGPDDNGRRDAISNRGRDQSQLHFREEPSRLGTSLVHQRTTGIHYKLLFLYNVAATARYKRC